MSDISNRSPKYETNPRFKYPHDYVRFLDAQKQIDAMGTSGSINAPTTDLRSFAIKRGFIKNLQPATLVNAPLLGTCYFQFNPQEIRQSVQMREDIYNPIALTPEQLAQPIGGNVNFQFDLFFDRSYELSGRPGGSGLRISESPDDTSNDPTGRGADQIGVYADLKVLYNIIGQGLSDGAIDLQLEMLKGTYNAKVARENAYTPKTEGGTDTATTTTTSDDTGDPFTNDFTDKQALLDFFNSNIGNSAFLMPNPVRIVFSPLLMVDGFVTATNVDFLKFTSEMIPMQCRVAMSVNALYVGFNKKSTFLTKTIDTARQVLVEERATDTQSVNTVEKELLKLNPFRIGLGYSPPLESWSDAMYNGPSGNQLVFFLAGNDTVEANNRVAYTGFPTIKPNGASVPDSDPILKLFEDSSITFSISYTWQYKIYGKAGQNQANGVGYTQQEAQYIASLASSSKNIYSDGQSRPTLSVIGGNLVGNYYSTETARSKDEWGSGTTGEGAARERIRRRTYLGIPNNSSSVLDVGTVTQSGNSVRRQNVLNSYYVVQAYVEISVTSGTITKKLVPQKDNGYISVLRGSDYTGVTSGYTNVPQKLTSITYAKAS